MAIFWIPMLMGLPLLGAAVGFTAALKKGPSYAFGSVFSALISVSASIPLSALLAEKAAPSLLQKACGSILAASPTLEALCALLLRLLLLPLCLLAIRLFFSFLRLFLPRRDRKRPSPASRLFSSLSAACASFFYTALLSAGLLCALFLLSHQSTLIRRGEKPGTECKAAVVSVSVLKRILPAPLSTLLSLKTEDSIISLTEETELLGLLFSAAGENTLNALTEERLESAGESPLGKQILWETLVNLRATPENFFAASSSPVIASLFSEVQLFLARSTKDTAAEDLSLLLQIYRLTEEYLPAGDEICVEFLLEGEFLPRLLSLLEEDPRFSPLKTAAIERLLASLSLGDRPWFSLAVTLLETAAKEAASPEDVARLLKAAARLTDLSVNDAVIACLSDYFYENAGIS